MFYEILVITFKITQCHNPEDHNQQLQHVKNPVLQLNTILLQKMRIF
jgi:hypothetical protein